MPTPIASRTAIGLALVTVYLTWGSTYLAIRIAVETIPPFAMAALRFVIAGALLYTFLRWRGVARPTLRQWYDNSIIGTLLLLGGNALVGWAEQFIASGVAALLIGVGPLFIVFTEWAWPGGERPTRLTMVALALGLFGVAWLAAPWESQHEGGHSQIAVLVILSACAFWSIGAIYSRHTKNGASPFMSAAMQMLGGCPAIILVGLLSRDFQRFDISSVSMQSWSAVIYLILVGSLIGFSSFVWLMKNVSPALASTHAFVNPLVAVILGWWILDEPLSMRTVTATITIITAVAIISLQKKKPSEVVPPRQAVAAVKSQATHEELPRREENSQVRRL